MKSTNNCIYVLQCLDLYIKKGGFTKNVEEANCFASLVEVKKACPKYWVIVKITRRLDECC